MPTGVDAWVLTVSCEVPEPVMDKGLNEQALALGSPVQERETALLNPFAGLRVTVEVAEPPAVTTVGESAEAETPKPGDTAACTTRDADTLCVSEPEVPTSATAYVPAGVVAEVETVTVDIPEPPCTSAGLNEHLVPLGSPVQESVTVPLNPLIGVMVVVEVAELPATTEDGASAVSVIWKSSGALFADVPPPQPPRLASRLAVQRSSRNESNVPGRDRAVAIFPTPSNAL